MLACYVANVCGKLATFKDANRHFLPLLLPNNCIFVVVAFVNSPRTCWLAAMPFDLFIYFFVNA